MPSIKGGRELVRLYFTNGNSATLNNATRVEDGLFTEGMTIAAFLCYDAQGNEIGRFRVDHVVGYDLAEQPTASTGPDIWS